VCPFGFSLVQYLLLDVESGMNDHVEWDGSRTISVAGDITVEDIEQWMVEMKAETMVGATAQRMALALATASNAVLGRRKHPRSIDETIRDATQFEEGLGIMFVEREILKNQPTQVAEKQFLERGAKVRRMAQHLLQYISVPAPRPPPLASAIVHTESAEKFAGEFFDFAQQECVRKGHGLPGLIRAVGIVIGKVSLEEVVFG
jgi:hypothetical protein